MAEAAVLGFQSHNVGVEVTGTTTTVPNNSTARLMYYLKCVNSCIPAFDIPERFLNYQNYYFLSNDDREKLVALVALLSPDLLNNKVFFLVDEDDLDSSNEFVKITVAKQTVAAVATAQGAVVINGKQVTAASVMLYKRSWLLNNYINPLRDMLSTISSQPSRSAIGYSSTPASQPARSTTSYYSTPATTSAGSEGTSPGCCYYLCCCCCCCD